MSESEAPPAVQKKGDWLATIATAGEVQTALSPIAFEPTDLPSLVKVAELFSRSNLVPEALRGKPDDVLLVLWTGREFGLGMIASLKNVHVIKGTTTFSADALHGLVKACPECLYFHLVETTGEQATYETHRRGEPKSVALTYTIGDAKQAGLLSKPNWSGNTKAMLRAAAKRSLARAVYGDVIAGLYSPDELQEGPGVIDVTPEPEKPAAPVETKTEGLARKAKEKRQSAAPARAPDVEVISASEPPPLNPPEQAPPAVIEAPDPELVAALRASLTAAPVIPFAAPVQESLMERAKRPLYRTPDFVEALEARAELAGMSRNELADRCLRAYGLSPRELPDPKWQELVTWVEKEVARAEEPKAEPAISEAQMNKAITLAEMSKLGEQDKEEPEVALRKLVQKKYGRRLDTLTDANYRELVMFLATGAA